MPRSLRLYALTRGPKGRGREHRPNAATPARAVYAETDLSGNSWQSSSYRRFAFPLDRAAKFGATSAVPRKSTAAKTGRELGSNRAARAHTVEPAYGLLQPPLLGKDFLGVLA